MREDTRTGGGGLPIGHISPELTSFRTPISLPRALMSSTTRAL